MRILVTGASGFLGRHLMPLLKQHDVMRLTRSTAEPSLMGEGGKSLIADLSHEGSWQEEVERFSPEYCIHLAWEGLPDYSLTRCRVNLNTSLMLLETLVKARVKRVVVAGSCWEYGRASGPVREDMAPIDCGVFASTKHAVRTVFDSIARDAGFECRWARLFFVYGSGQRSTSLIPNLYSAYALGRSPSLREPHVGQDFVYVDDVARGLWALAQCDAPSGIFNIGSGQMTSVASVANLVATSFDKPMPFTLSSEVSGFWADTRHTFAATGWRAETEINDGIAKTLAALEDAA